MFAELKTMPTFASSNNETQSNAASCLDGSVVQLVRIHACHAWGRGFESRPDRQQKIKFRK